MKRKWILILLVALLVGGFVPFSVPRLRSVAYIEPALLAAGEAQRSVVVSAVSSAVAARAVERAGGQVTSELWLIDAVAAAIHG